MEPISETLDFNDFVNGTKQLKSEDATKLFEAIGYRKARALYDSQAISPPIHRAMILEWLGIREDEIRQRETLESREFTTRSVAAAERAARAAMWAAVLSLIGTLVTLALALYRGELPPMI